MIVGVLLVLGVLYRCVEVTLTKRQLRWLVMERFSTAEFIFGVMLGSLAGFFIGVAIGAHMR